MTLAWNNWSGKLTCRSYNYSLKINEACLKIVSNYERQLFFYTRNVECVGCDFVALAPPLRPHSSATFLIDTNYPFESYLTDGYKNYCRRVNHFEDFGYYSMSILNNNVCTNVSVIKKPEKLWVNLGVLLGIVFIVSALLWLICRFARIIYRRCELYWVSSNVPLRELEMDLGSARSTRIILTSRSRQDRMNERRRSRIASLDAFRGLCIVLMIFVNYGGGQYSIFKHSPWNGLTIADLVFPWFVWIMGASIVLSFRANLRTSTSRKKIFFNIARRSALLILGGLSLNSEHRYEDNLRYTGVLQRLGITYFIVASVEGLTAQPQVDEENTPKYCREVLNTWIQWILMIALVTAHELITFLLPVPGCPTGYLGPGGLSDRAKYKNCTGGAAGYIDRLIITENHMYHHGSFVNIFKPNVPYDPEGLLGILTSVLCSFLGVLAARIILCYQDPIKRIKRWYLWAVVFGSITVALTFGSTNGGPIPMNKNLWSLSYVLFASYSAFLILAVFYWLIDLTHIWGGAPLIYPGMNAIALYVGHSMAKKNLPWRWVPYTNTHMEILVMDVMATVIWSLISYVMYRYNVFITL